MAKRSPEIPVWDWWLDEVRDLLEQDQKAGRGLIQLGKDLQRLVGRAKPFSHSVLSRFKAGEIGVTLELAQALCLEFSRLPPPVFFPQSRQLASDLMLAVANDHMRKLRQEPKAEAPNIFGKKPQPKTQRAADHATSPPAKQRGGK